MTVDYEIFENVLPTDKTWAQWKATVESEGWTSDDHAALELVPLLKTTRSVVAKDKDGDFIGSVVWSEHDDIAWIGYYLLRPEYRGKGVGSIVWKRALSLMPKNYTIGLRAVPYMAPRYKSMDTPIDGGKLIQYSVSWERIFDLCEERSLKDANVKSIKDLSIEEQAKYEEFDQKVTGKDRSDLLRRFFALPFTAGNVLFNDQNEIVAAAAIVPVSTEDKHMFKLSPIYADSLKDVFTVIKSLVNFASERDPKASILFQVLDGTPGEKELVPLLNSLNPELTLVGITEFSKENKNPIDVQKLYVPHNNSGHYDA